MNRTIALSLLVIFFLFSVIDYTSYTTLTRPQVQAQQEDFVKIPSESNTTTSSAVQNIPSEFNSTTITTTSSSAVQNETSIPKENMNWTSSLKISSSLLDIPKSKTDITFNDAANIAQNVTGMNSSAYLIRLGEVRDYYVYTVLTKDMAGNTHRTIIDPVDGKMLSHKNTTSFLGPQTNSTSHYNVTQMLGCEQGTILVITERGVNICVPPSAFPDNISLNNATTIASNAVGADSTPFSAEQQVINGYLVYRVLVEDENGNIHNVIIDAGNGTRLAEQQVTGLNPPYQNRTR
jgi:uncharacterized membrane protein YkoI